MKRLFALLLASTFCSFSWSQPLQIAQLSGPEGEVHDKDYGVSFVCPTGWKLVEGYRWEGDDEETTLFMQVSAISEAVPAVYYQTYYEPFAPADGFDAWLQREAARKVEMRVRGNTYSNYLNRPSSYQTRTINGCAALSWIADYSIHGHKWCELFTHIVDSMGHVQFSINVPAEKVAEVQPAYEALIASTHITEAPLIRNLNPRVLEARRLYQAKDYAQALQAFAEGLQAESTRAKDLVAGAGAAAALGERDLALRWLRLAMAKGWKMTPRVSSNPDFAALHDTDEWKQLVAAMPSHAARVSEGTDKGLQAKLVAILEEDQKYRLQLDDVEKTFGRNSKELRQLWKTIEEKDKVNLLTVTKILDENGWLGPETVGSDGSDALFLVIQHADHATQLKYLPLMRDAVKNKKAEASSLALLEDRVAIGEGRRQIYGSQIRRDEGTGSYRVLPLEDPDHVDQRRASVGLSPLSDYVAHWAITWDVEAFKKQQNQEDSGKERRSP
jgi:hypothetical protein